MQDFIYLASQSPRRSQLLTQMGVAHELLLPDDGEDSEALEALLPREAPAAGPSRSTTVTAWPSAASAWALASPTRPAPITITFMRKSLAAA